MLETAVDVNAANVNANVDVNANGRMGKVRPRLLLRAAVDVDVVDVCVLVSCVFACKLRYKYWSGRWQTARRSNVCQSYVRMQRGQMHTKFKALI